MTLAQFKAIWRMGFRPMLLRSLINRRLIWKLDAGQIAFIGQVTLATFQPPQRDTDATAFLDLYAGTGTSRKP